MIIPEGYAQANLHFTGTGVPTGAQVTLGLDVSGVALPLTDICDIIGDGWASTNMDVMQSSSVTLSKVSLKVGPNDTGPAAELAMSFSGTQTTPCPPNTAWLVQKLTGFGGRTGRGRFFIPGIPESVVDAGGNIDGSYVTSAIGYCEAFFDLLVAADLFPVLLHGADSPVQTPRLITALVPSSKVASQRRRLRR